MPRCVRSILLYGAAGRQSVQERWYGVSAADDPRTRVLAGVEVLGSAGAHRAASIDEEHWVPKVRGTDVLLVSGGDALYLCDWMRPSGSADLMPSLGEAVYVGLIAG